MATKKKGTEPPSEPEVTSDEKPQVEESDSPKIGRQTLALILGHLEKRESKNDELGDKQTKQGWWLALLLVLGLLASIGVAGAVKLYGADISFTPEKPKEAPTPAP